jgi:hypothetical protein
MKMEIRIALEIYPQRTLNYENIAYLLHMREE